MKRFFIFLLLVSGLVGSGAWLWLRSTTLQPLVVYADPPALGLWRFQAVDTMKYSRDLAREKLRDSTFDAVIERQVAAIAATGATHVAIATPYDEEFLPFLRRWVTSARSHGLKVWFRGNWSGWEEWFGYPRITREEHVRQTENFIRAHPDLFVDGDAFSSCPECENGGPGDPRQTGDVTGHRAFLIAEYEAMNRAFAGIGKHVRTNLFSMNGDVAQLVMDPATTAALGGIVTIDHYVATPEILERAVRSFAAESHGQVVLGEFGAPIPDIHGRLTPEEQAQWIDHALAALSKIPQLAGVNYWLSVGGSTALWNEEGKATPAVAVLTRYFQSRIFSGRVFDEFGQPLDDVAVSMRDRRTRTNADGYFELAVPAFRTGDHLVFFKFGYLDQSITPDSESVRTVTLVKSQKTIAERVLLELKKGSERLEKWRHKFSLPALSP